jgi:hypothetical protein
LLVDPAGCGLGGLTTGSHHIVGYTACLGPSLLRGLLDDFTSFAERLFSSADGGRGRRGGVPDLLAKRLPGFGDTRFKAFIVRGPSPLSRADPGQML